MYPPLCFTIPYTIDRPSPVPFPCSFVVKKGSNSRARVAASIPVPVSATLSLAYEPGLALDVRDGARLVELQLVEAHRQPPAAGHRIARVDDEVQHHLLDLRGIGQDHHRGRRSHQLEFDFRPDQPAQHRVHPADDVAERDQPRAGRLPAAERQQLTRQPGAPLHRMLDFRRFRTRPGRRRPLRSAEGRPSP